MTFYAWILLSWTLLSVNEAQSNPKTIHVTTTNFKIKYLNNQPTFIWKFQNDVKYCLCYNKDNEITSAYSMEAVKGNGSTCRTQSNYSCVGIEQLNSTVVHLGNQLTLPCTADSENYCEWSVNNNNYIISISSPGNHQKMSHRSNNNCSLIIHRINPWNTGFYACLSLTNKTVLALYYLSINDDHTTNTNLTNVNVLIIVLSILCAVVIVLTCTVIYFYKSYKKQLSVSQENNDTRKQSDTLKTRLTKRMDTLLENVHSVTAPKQTKLNEATTSANDNQEKQVIYSQLNFPANNSALKNIHQKGVENVAYATILH
ncbi:hypothetical protein CHUAL_003603 [Chamberlinius hualienensis]